MFILIDTIKSELDMIMLEVTEDILFLQLPELADTLTSLFDVFTTIQTNFMDRNKILAEVIKAYKKRGKFAINLEECDKMSRALCQACSRNI